MKMKEFKKFNDALIIVLWIVGICAIWINHDVAFMCWAYPAGAGVGNAVADNFAQRR